VTRPVTRPDIEVMLARAEEATPGPLLFRGKSDSIHTPPSAEEKAQGYTYGNQIARFTCDHDGVSAVRDGDLELWLHASTDLPTLAAYALELEATLANERGEGAPPDDRWEWVRSQWETREGAFGGWECIVRRSGNGWHFEWVDYSDDADDNADEWPDGDATHARAAMRLATLALTTTPK
jgi:hypothetical protein